MHFDERLDDALEQHGSLTPQRFSLNVEPLSPAVREFYMDPFGVCFIGEDPVPLDPMIDAIDDLLKSLEEAIDTLADRNPPQLEEGY